VDIEGDIVHGPDLSERLGDAGELHDGTVVVGNWCGHEERSFAEDKVGLSERREEIAGKAAETPVEQRDPLRLRIGRSLVGRTRWAHRA
jgi:hypothetical protein